MQPKQSEFFDDLKQQEAERAVRMDQEENATKMIFDKMRENPNA